RQSELGIGGGDRDLGLFVDRIVRLVASSKVGVRSQRDDAEPAPQRASPGVFEDLGWSILAAYEQELTQRLLHLVEDRRRLLDAREERGHVGDEARFERCDRRRVAARTRAREVEVRAVQ